VVLAPAELVEFRLPLRVRVCHRQGRREASITARKLLLANVWRRFSYLTMELHEETTFLDELMSLSLRQEAPWHQAFSGGSGGVMMSDPLFYGGEGTDPSSGGMDLSLFQELAPMPPVAAPPPLPHPQEEFNFDWLLSEVCTPYGRSSIPVPGGEPAAGGQRLAPLHDAVMMEEETISGDKLGRYGGGGSPTFVFGGKSSENHRSKSKIPRAPPSKNLMAERRRRKRLNDRLSMLRSIVPKISKVLRVMSFPAASPT
jgi:hypothetical protein